MMKIGELAKMAGCTSDTVRFYEKEGLLPQAERTEANYRTYTEAHAERLRFIRNCRALDMTHDEIRLLLRMSDGPASDCGAINELLDEHIRHVEIRLSELQQLQTQLVALRDQCDGAHPVSDCGIMQGLAAMESEQASGKKKDTHLG